MRLQRLTKEGTPLEVSILALLNVAGGVTALMAIVHPLSRETPRELQAILAGCGLLIALSLLLAGPRVRTWMLHAVMVLNVGLIGVMVASAVTQRGMMVSTLVYLWAGIYIALFFSPAVVRRYAALMSVSFGVALICAHSPTDITIWVVVCATIWTAVMVLSGLSERLRVQAHSDALTGLLNRNGFREAALRRRAIAVRGNTSIALCVIDLDGFKMVNDEGGHAAGDRLLADLATAWQDALRPGDLLARHGGDEFVLLLPATTAPQAEDVLARLSGAHGSSWTAGVVVWEHGESLDECIARADDRLYAAKALTRAAVPPALADVT